IVTAECELSFVDHLYDGISAHLELSSSGGICTDRRPREKDCAVLIKYLWVNRVNRPRRRAKEPDDGAWTHYFERFLEGVFADAVIDNIDAAAAIKAAYLFCETTRIAEDLIGAGFVR